MATRYRAKLYQSDGATLQYTFPAVQDTNIPRESSERSIIHSNVRGKGAIIIPGGTDHWDLFLLFTITGTDYEDITSKIDTLTSSIQPNVAYILKFDKTSNTVWTEKVKRIEPIEWLNNEEDKRVFRQQVRITFVANAW